MKFREMARELRKEGFIEERHGKGTHIIFKHPHWGRITVPHNQGGRDLNRGLVKEIRCQVKRAKRGEYNHNRGYGRIYEAA